MINFALLTKPYDASIDVWSLGLLGSMSAVFRKSKMRHPVITKSRQIGKFGRVTITIIATLDVADFQLEATQQ